jgi:polysaccharide chain length determinant protein (PEP-CTERM system associated)
MPVNEIIALLISEIRSAWRFRWQGVAAAWAVFLIGFAWLVWQPDIYEAQARVYVDTSSVLRPILRDRIVASDLATELSYVRQALLGRKQLERVARENNLVVNATNGPQTDTIINQLGQDIDISTNADTNSVYSISYRNSDRNKAVGVVMTLLNTLVESTLGANEKGTDTAGQFLDARIAEYENRLSRAEEALADFKKKNADRLPGSEGGFFERMRAEKEGLEKRERDLRLAMSKRDRLQQQLNSQSPIIPNPEILNNQPQPNSLDARIRDAQAALDKLLLQYTDKHPDVINQRAQLERLEEQRAEELKALGVETPNREIGSLDASPIYQQLRIALNQTEVEIDALEEEIKERKQNVAVLQASINEVPEVEAELARLNRDYNVVYDQYQSLVRSRETQELSRKAADTDNVEFRVIDPPFADYRPVAPNRLLILMAIFVAALGACGGLCWLLAQIRPVFNNARDLREVCALPVLGVVSRAFEVRHKRQRRLAVVAFCAAVGGLVFMFATTAAVEVMGPGFRMLIGIGS